MEVRYEHLPEDIVALRAKGSERRYVDSHRCPQNEVRPCKERREVCCLGKLDKQCATNCPNNQK